KQEACHRLPETRRSGMRKDCSRFLQELHATMHIPQNHEATSASSGRYGTCLKAGYFLKRGSRLRRLVVIAIGVVAIGAAAYVALLLWYDGNRIGDAVSERMLARHGIVLEFERVERSFAPRPLISLAGLRVENAEQRDRELVAIDTASFRVHPLSWFSGSVSLDRIQIDGLRFTIPVDDQ